VSYNFDTDPTDILKLYGNATYSSSGGNPDTGGYLSLTEAVNSQRSAIVFDDIDNGSVVKAFSSRWMCVSATAAHPADGFSVNYVRAKDQVLADPLNGWATWSRQRGQPARRRLHDQGLGIGFDAYDSGSGDVIGVSVRVDNILIAQSVPAAHPQWCSHGSHLVADRAFGIRTMPGEASSLTWQPFRRGLWRTPANLAVKIRGRGNHPRRAACRRPTLPAPDSLCSWPARAA
jgi:hypothetical protein